MNKNFISLCAGILLGVSPLFAVPAKPVLVRVAQQDVAKMVSIVMPSCLQRDWLLRAM